MDDAAEREVSALTWLRSVLASTPPTALAVARHACAVFGMLRELPPGRSGARPAISFDRFMRDFIPVLQLSLEAPPPVRSVHRRTSTNAPTADPLGHHSLLVVIRTVHMELMPVYLAEHTPIQVHALLLGVALDACPDATARVWVRSLAAVAADGPLSNSGDGVDGGDGGRSGGGGLASMEERLAPIARLPEFSDLIASVRAETERWEEHAGSGAMLADSRGFGPALGPAQTMVVLALLRPALLVPLVRELIDVVLGPGLPNRLIELTRGGDVMLGGSPLSSRVRDGKKSDKRGQSRSAVPAVVNHRSHCRVSVVCEEPNSDAVEHVYAAWITQTCSGSGASVVASRDSVAPVVPVFVSLADAGDAACVFSKAREAANRSAWLVVLDCARWERCHVIELINAARAAGVMHTFLCCGAIRDAALGDNGGSASNCADAVPWRVRAEGMTLVAPAHDVDSALRVEMRRRWLQGTVGGGGHVQGGPDTSANASSLATVVARVVTQLESDQHSAASVGSELATQAAPFARCLLASLAHGRSVGGSDVGVAETADRESLSLEFLRRLVAAHVETAVSPRLHPRVARAVDSTVTDEVMSGRTMNKKEQDSVDYKAGKELREWLRVLLK